MAPLCRIVAQLVREFCESVKVFVSLGSCGLAGFMTGPADCTGAQVGKQAGMKAMIAIESLMTRVATHRWVGS